MTIVSFTGSPAGGERVVVTVNGTPVVCAAMAGDTPGTIAQKVSEAINRVGVGGHHGNALRARAGVDFAGAAVNVYGDHSGSSWEPVVTAEAEAPIVVSLERRIAPEAPSDPRLARVA